MTFAPSPRDFTHPSTGRRWPPPLNEPAASTPLGDRLALVLPAYDAEWRQHLSDLLSLPLSCIPKSGSASEEPAPLGARKLDKHPSIPPSGRASRYDLSCGFLCNYHSPMAFPCNHGASLAIITPTMTLAPLLSPPALTFPSAGCSPGAVTSSRASLMSQTLRQGSGLRRQLWGAA